ncbi:hypothetical protein VNO77_25279 [Canavalia gladiata]|uniref:Uncharacterized protein n=1 Tax=Canavalia gladiata TaxID=3824 RepID=A0AAN9QGZ1_CANGL
MYTIDLSFGIDLDPSMIDNSIAKGCCGPPSSFSKHLYVDLTTYYPDSSLVHYHLSLHSLVNLHWHSIEFRKGLALLWRSYLPSFIQMLAAKNGRISTIMVCFGDSPIAHFRLVSTQGVSQPLSLMGLWYGILVLRTHCFGPPNASSHPCEIYLELLHLLSPK